MRINSISASGLFSFEGFRLDLDPRATVIVGPNGSGKSNLLRLIEVAISGLESAELGSDPSNTVMQAFLEARYRGGRDSAVLVGMDIAITDDDERQLIASFIQSSIYSSLVSNWSGAESREIADWVLHEVTDEALQSLWQGSLVVHHPGHGDARWDVGFEFVSDGVRYRWPLGWDPSSTLVSRVERTPTAGPIRPEPLARRVLGVDQVQPPKVPEGRFLIGALLPEDGVGVEVQANPQGTPLAGPHRRFADRHRLNLSARNRSFTLGISLLTILRRNIVRTSDSRLVPIARTGSLSNAGGPAAERDLPDFLFGLKNGEQSEREQYKRVGSLFSDLTGGRHLDVGQRQLKQGEATPVIRVGVDADFEVPVEFAGAGAWEALVLASTLGQPGGSVLVLDEPAIGLSPTLQRHLLTHLRSAESQIVLVTHSPYLLPLYPDSVDASIVRVTREGLASRAWTVRGSDYRRIASKLIAKGNDRVPFAQGVVLCEGQVDVEVVNVLAARRRLLMTENNILAVDCGGRENLPDYVEFCAALGIPHLVVTDGDESKVGEPAVARQVNAVRDNVAKSPDLGKLFEFAENVERAFGLQHKNHRELIEVANTTDLDSGEAGGIARALASFLDDVLHRARSQTPR